MAEKAVYGDRDMKGNSVLGLRAAIANGEALRYEQLAVAIDPLSQFLKIGNAAQHPLQVVMVFSLILSFANPNYQYAIVVEDIASTQIYFNATQGDFPDADVATQNFDADMVRIGAGEYQLHYDTLKGFPILAGFVSTDTNITQGEITIDASGYQRFHTRTSAGARADIADTKVAVFDTLLICKLI